MALEATRSTALHVAKADDRESYTSTIVTANGTYLCVAFDFELDIVWLGTHSSPDEMDLMRSITPTTVFAAATSDIRDIATYLTRVADALEDNEGNVAKAYKSLFEPQEEEPVEEEKPKRRRKKKEGDD